MRIFTHPLRDGVILILEKHFAPEIVKKFKLIFEAQAFQGKNIINQLKDDKVALEVYYEGENGTEHICDVWSWMNKKEAEVHLLRHITDAARAERIGKNWIETKDGRISEEVSTGNYETKNEN